MAIQRCPLCDLNYVKPGMQYCKVCMKDLEKKQINDEIAEICPICGENTVVENNDLCESCLKERVSMSGYRVDTDDDTDDLLQNDDMDGMRVLNLENDITETLTDDFSE